MAVSREASEVGLVGHREEAAAVRGWFRRSMLRVHRRSRHQVQDLSVSRASTARADQWSISDSSQRHQQLDGFAMEVFHPWNKLNCLDRALKVVLQKVVNGYNVTFVFNLHLSL
jgi:hypothetical protein